MYDLEEVRLDVENFCSELGNEWFLSLAGLKDKMNFSAIYARMFKIRTKNNKNEMCKEKH
jgi:hypothetical protein